MTAIDPIAAVRSIESDVPLMGHTEVDHSMERFFVAIQLRGGKRHSTPWRKGALNVAAVALAAVVCLIVWASLPGGQASSPAVADELLSVAKVAAAADDPPATLKPGQYVLARSTTTTSSNTTFTQAKLDHMAKQQYAIARANAKHRNGHFARKFAHRNSVRSSPDEALEMTQLARLKAGVNIKNLPTRTISVSQSMPYAEWINDEHIGAGGGIGPSTLKFGSPDQARAAKILERAGLFFPGDSMMDMSFMSGKSEFEDFTWPGSEIAKLPTSPSALQATLYAKPTPLVDSPAGRKSERWIHDESELFHASVGLLRSPFSSPDLRSALLQMLGGLQGVEVTSGAADERGRPGVGVAIVTHGIHEQVVLDAATSQVLGVNYRRIRSEEDSGQRYVPGVSDLTDVRYSVSYEPTIVVQVAPVCRYTIGHGTPAETYCESKVRPVKR